MQTFIAAQSRSLITAGQNPPITAEIRKKDEKMWNTLNPFFRTTPKLY